MTEPTSAQPTPPSQEESPVTADAVLATRLLLRTGLMWAVAGAILLGIIVVVVVGPKAGAYFFALIAAVVGTMRWVLPGAPFGITAREKWVDVVFCYGIAASIVFLASTSYGLRCAQGWIC